MKPTGIIIGILGLWTITAGALRLAMTPAIWNNVIVGVIVAIAGFSLARFARGAGALSGILGLWLIVSGFIPAMTGGAFMINNIIVGVVLAIAGFSNSGRTPASREAETRRAA